MASLRHDKAQFLKVGTGRISKLRQLADREIPRPLAHQYRLLHYGFDPHEAHRGLGHGGADSLSIGDISFTLFDEGLDVGWWDLADRMAELCQLSRLIIRPGKGFHTKQA